MSCTEKFKMIDNAYGKDDVRLLYVDRRRTMHQIRELKVSTRLTLDSLKDYEVADNRDVVATDTQKNVVHVLANRHGVSEPELFAQLVARTFIQQYPHVTMASVGVEEVPWQRLEVTDGPHSHAFLHQPSCIRFCSVELKKHASGAVEDPVLIAGLRGLRIIKTTQSMFRNFHKDAYRTLDDTSDRVFSTEVTAKWVYQREPQDFGVAWKTVRDAILWQFAGSAVEGLLSPSVQNTIYKAQHRVFQALPQVSEIEISMPNRHYLPMNLGHFKDEAASPERPGEKVLLPLLEPSGLIYAKQKRKTYSAKL